jgi:hypothetical protein
MVDGTRIADNWDDLTDEHLFSPINLGPDGVLVESRIWTNTAPDGTTYGPFSCANWTNATSLEVASFGVSIFSNYFWTALSVDERPCDTAQRLYCFQQSG